MRKYLILSMILFSTTFSQIKSSSWVENNVPFSLNFEEQSLNRE